ncbi:hypothetical protein Tco_0649174 [Tanacetum coccineum]
MHNNIMAAGSRGSSTHACNITLCTMADHAVPATEDSPAVPEQTTVETVTNMTPENRAHYESEKKLSFDIGLN